MDDGVVGGCFYRRELERLRASGSVRDHEVPTSASIDSRVSLKDGALSDFPRFIVSFLQAPPLLCSRVHTLPDWCASSPTALSPSPLGVSGLFAMCKGPCALVAALPSFGSMHSWSSGLSTRIFVRTFSHEIGFLQDQHLPVPVCWCSENNVLYCTEKFLYKPRRLISDVVHCGDSPQPRSSFNPVDDSSDSTATPERPASLAEHGCRSLDHAPGARRQAAGQGGGRRQV